MLTFYELFLINQSGDLWILIKQPLQKQLSLFKDSSVNPVVLIWVNTKK